MNTTILNSTQIENKIIRLTHQILENNFDEKQLILVGLNERGNILASKINLILKQIFPGSLLHLSLLSKRNENKEIIVAENQKFEIEDLKNKTLIVFDDVVDSGQTLMFATSYLLKFQPKKIQTLALVDRNHRNFPIKVDYIGHHVATTLHEHVVVELSTELQSPNCIAYLK